MASHKQNATIFLIHTPHKPYPIFSISFHLSLCASLHPTPSSSVQVRVTRSSSLVCLARLTVHLARSSSPVHVARLAVRLARSSSLVHHARSSSPVRLTRSAICLARSSSLVCHARSCVALPPLTPSLASRRHYFLLSLLSPATLRFSALSSLILGPKVHRLCLSLAIN